MRTRELIQQEVRESTLAPQAPALHTCVHVHTRAHTYTAHGALPPNWNSLSENRLCEDRWPFEGRPAQPRDLSTHAAPLSRTPPWTRVIPVRPPPGKKSTDLGCWTYQVGIGGVGVIFWKGNIDR